MPSPVPQDRVESRIARPREGHFGERAFWIAAPEPDAHAAFRADLDLAAPTEVMIMIQAATSFRLWLDGATITTGPLRFAAGLPEFHTERVRLQPGPHAFAVQATGGELESRIGPSVPSFLWLKLITAQGELPLRWTGRRLTEYAATGLRTSPLLDRLEWLDRPLDPAWRTDPATPELGWEPVVPVGSLANRLGPSTRGVVDLPRWPLIRPAETARGTFRETYTGYRFDDPAVQFLLADLHPDAEDDHDGNWIRYDLGRTRIGTLELTVAAERPAVITVALAERLSPYGDLAPVTALSTGPTQTLQHFTVDAGITRLEPVGALAGRYAEVRVATDGPAEVREVIFRDRDFLGEPRGTFDCGDDVLNRIWAVGLDTMRACAEDAIIDSPRERAEWTGDLAAAGIDLLVTGWGDLRLVHRSLLHAAVCAREDGLVGGCVPGTPIYHVTYAAQWLGACVRVADYDADPGILAELHDAGRANVDALHAVIEKRRPGQRRGSFVDWGYGAPEDGPDPATSIFVWRGLTAWARWQQWLGRDEAPRDADLRRRLAGELRSMIGNGPAPGYHVATLAGLTGLLPATAAAPIIRAHLRAGFPFDRDAARLRDPARVDAGAVTPYFTNFSLPVLLEAGEADTALDLWRRGWGWLLDRGATTWWEVFDDRWSGCHFWSGAPTWQLTRHLLGASVTGDRMLNLRVTPGSLPSCRGTLPIGRDEVVDLEWRRDGDALDYTVRCDRDQLIMTDSGPVTLDAGRSVLRLRSADGLHFVVR